MSILNLVCDILYVFLIIRVFLLYLPQNKYTKMLKPVIIVTEPVLSKIRNGIPPTTLGFDAAPFIAMVLLYLIQQILAKLISIF